jgi:hypothetical protein
MKRYFTTIRDCAFELLARFKNAIVILCRWDLSEATRYLRNGQEIIGKLFSAEGQYTKLLHLKTNCT